MGEEVAGEGLHYTQGCKEYGTREAFPLRTGADWNQTRFFATSQIIWEFSHRELPPDVLTATYYARL